MPVLRVILPLLRSHAAYVEKASFPAILPLWGTFPPQTPDPPLKNARFCRESNKV